VEKAKVQEKGRNRGKIDKMEEKIPFIFIPQKIFHPQSTTTTKSAEKLGRRRQNISQLKEKQDLFLNLYDGWND
jgi:hypothetical protein